MDGKDAPDNSTTCFVGDGWATGKEWRMGACLQARHRADKTPRTRKGVWGISPHKHAHKHLCQVVAEKDGEDWVEKHLPYYGRHPTT